MSPWISRTRCATSCGMASYRLALQSSSAAMSPMDQRTRCTIEGHRGLVRGSLLLPCASTMLKSRMETYANENERGYCYQGSGKQRLQLTTIS